MFDFLKKKFLKKEEPLVFCKDCVYCLVESSGLEYAKCGKNIKEEIVVDLVSGKSVKQRTGDSSHYCTTERLSNSDTSCQKIGKFFKSKIKFQ